MRILFRIFFFFAFLCWNGLIPNFAFAQNNPTIGGEGGTVIIVTNLNDSGPGSFREALATKGSRIIRFSVGGEIWLRETLPIRQPFVTVEGESAPSPGITLMGDRVNIRTHDVILRNIRVRVGALLTSSDPQNRDGIQINGAEDGSDPGYNILVENCSVSWAVDENIQIWGKNNHDIVVRNCIIAEGLSKSIHPKGGTHSAGLVVGPGISRLLIQGNLFASNAFRNPVISADSSAVVVNNLISNPGFGAFHLYGRPGEVKSLSTVVGNVIVAGKDTKPALSLFHEKGLNAGSQIYLKDNIAIGTQSFDPNSRPAGWATDGPSPFVPTPPVQIPEGIQIFPSGEVEATVLAQAGARPRDRDEVDKRIVEEVKTRSGSIKDFPPDVRLCPQKAAVPTGAMGTYATLLEKYVSPAGVRYAAWKTSAEDCAALQKVVDDIASSREDGLAFYLNAYNVWVLHQVLQKYPLKNIHEPDPTAFENSRIKVAGSEMTLAGLEKEISARFHDPRTVFALNRASRGGPKLIGEPFSQETIGTQLDAIAGSFINSTQGVLLKEQDLKVSALFNWKQDQLPKGIVGTINTFRHRRIPENAKITFQDFDWTLNETPSGLK